MKELNKILDRIIYYSGNKDGYQYQIRWKGRTFSSSDTADLVNKVLAYEAKQEEAGK